MQFVASLELENRCLLSKFFLRGKSHTERDQGNKMVIEVPEYDVFTVNLAPGETLEPAPYRDGVIVIACNRKLRVNVKKLKVEDGGRVINASKYGIVEEEAEALDLTEGEVNTSNTLKAIWEGILSMEVDDSTDFFKSGAGSMDVAR
ncbi:hypothetical protein AVEN_266732-1 [Araneus ventricosus]|uniref:Uncharacterized protein n=1 Tax=Araneus ventricosus TaxID=182803 RepID=A0A4Y1ZUV9_ARAVE|nr:hypothetical protein AVEN_266732-1 [Araneus ventricosus]